jgi:hypothetical protein
MYKVPYRAPGSEKAWPRNMYYAPARSRTPDNRTPEEKARDRAALVSACKQWCPASVLASAALAAFGLVLFLGIINPRDHAAQHACTTGLLIEVECDGCGCPERDSHSVINDTNFVPPPSLMAELTDKRKCEADDGARRRMSSERGGGVERSLQSDGGDLYPCLDPEANCQCSRSKVDGPPELCGGPPGCWHEAGGRTTCEQHGDVWIGGDQQEDEEDDEEDEEDEERQALSSGGGDCTNRVTVRFAVDSAEMSNGYCEQFDAANCPAAKRMLDCGSDDENCGGGVAFNREGGVCVAFLPPGGACPDGHACVNGEGNGACLSIATFTDPQDPTGNSYADSDDLDYNHPDCDELVSNDYYGTETSYCDSYQGKSDHYVDGGKYGVLGSVLPLWYDARVRDVGPRKRYVFVEMAEPAGWWYAVLVLLPAALCALSRWMFKACGPTNRSTGQSSTSGTQIEMRTQA